MDLSRLTAKAKDMFARRGGSDAAKEDAQELKDIARSDASMGDKAKEGFEALKEPGAPGQERPPAGQERPPAGAERPPAGAERPPAGAERPPAGEERRPRP
jgi:hypothetical protein